MYTLYRKVYKNKCDPRPTGKYKSTVVINAIQKYVEEKEQ